MSATGDILRLVAEAATRNVVRLDAAKAETEARVGKAMDGLAGSMIENQRVLWNGFARELRDLADIEDER